MKLTPNRASLLVISFAIILRAFLMLKWRLVDWDFAWYATMAKTLAHTGAFFDPSTGLPTHHYPPLYSILLAPTYMLGGGIQSVKLISILLNAIAMPAIWYATRDLYGDKYAAIAVSIYALSPYSILVDALGYCEGLLTAFVTLTLWAIIKSLQRPGYITLAGLFAGLAFLTKASVGPFFVITGLSGILWRLKYQGTKGLTSKPYLFAIIIFGILVGSWTLRNILDFGLSGWETQPFATDSLLLAYHQPGFWNVLTYKIALLTFFTMMFVLPALLIANVKKGRITERTSVLLGAIGMTILISAIYSTGFNYSEGRPLFDINNMRYVVSITGVALFLLFEWKKAAPKLRTVAVVTALIFAAGFPLWAPNWHKDSHLPWQDIGEHLPPGARVQVEPSNLTHYIYATARDITITNQSPDYLITYNFTTQELNVTKE